MESIPDSGRPTKISGFRGTTARVTCRIARPKHKSEGADPGKWRGGTDSTGTVPVAIGRMQHGWIQRHARPGIRDERRAPDA